MKIRLPRPATFEEAARQEESQKKHYAKYENVQESETERNRRRRELKRKFYNTMYFPEK